MSAQPALSVLAAPARALFDEALALRAQWPADASDSDRARARTRFAEGMAAIGLPRFKVHRDARGEVVGWGERIIGRADALNAQQRAALVALVDHSDLFSNQFPVPASAWSRRAWLGLSPPGALWQPDAEGEPLFFSLRRLLFDGEGAFAEAVAAMPAVQRAPLLGDLDFSQSDLWCDTDALIQTVVSELDEVSAEWARAFAERVLAGEPQVEAVKQNHARARLAFAALVASGVPIEPRHDALLRLTRPQKPGLFDAWISAIPEARREAALLGALDHLSFTSDHLRTIAHLLLSWPFAALAIHAELHFASALNKPLVKSKLAAAYAAHPHLKVAVAAWRKAQPKPLKLKVTAVRALAEMLPLSATHAAQLEIATHEYNGAVCSAAQVAAGVCGAPKPILPETVEYTRFEGTKGKPAYEQWGLMTDSGTIFLADATEIVGVIIQFSVQCEDKRLEAALQLAR